MELIDLLQQAHSGQGLGTIGEQFGLDETQTAAAVQELAPVIAAGLRRNMAQSPENVVALVQALKNGNHTQYLDNAEALQFGNVASDGNAILGHIFGSKDVSREVAMRAASSAAGGIGSSIMKQLLPVIASMVIGTLTKKMTGGTSAPAPRGGGLGGGDGGGDCLCLELGNQEEPGPWSGQRSCC